MEVQKVRRPLLGTKIYFNYLISLYKLQLTARCRPKWRPDQYRIPSARMESFTSQDGCPKICGRITAQGALKTRSAKMAIVRAQTTSTKLDQHWHFLRVNSFEHPVFENSRATSRKRSSSPCLSPLELCQYILAKGVRKHGSEAIF